MSKKEYELIANILKQFNTDIEEDLFNSLITVFAYEFKKNNDNFNQDKFFEACK
jgi:hypothetical protein